MAAISHKPNQPHAKMSKKMGEGRTIPSGAFITPHFDLGQKVYFKPPTPETDHVNHVALPLSLLFLMHVTYTCIYGAAYAITFDICMRNVFALHEAQQ